MRVAPDCLELAHDWRERASCAGHDPRWWYLDADPDNWPRAVGICQDCPVRLECYADATRAQPHTSGVIRGGQTFGDRKEKSRVLARLAADWPRDQIDAARAAYSRGERTEWAVTGTRIYDRQRKAYKRVVLGGVA